MAAALTPSAATATLPERLLLSLLALGTVAALYLLRAADDNRLTSWAWAFAGVDPARLLALAAAAIALALLLARLPLPGPGPAVLFLAACAAAAPCWRAPEVMVDASRYFTQAKHLELYGVRHFLAEWGRAVPAWTDLPLVPFLYGLAFRLVGESRPVAQALATGLFAGAVALTWALGKALWDEELGSLAGALLLAVPGLLPQAPSLLVDVPTMFFLLLALLAVLRALQRGGAARILLAGAALALAALAKYSTWLLLSGLPLLALAARRGGAPRPLRTAALVAVAAAVPLGAALLWWHATFAGQLALLASYQAPGLGRWGESFASTFLFQAHPFLTAAALLSLGVALRRRDVRWAAVAWPLLLMLALQVRRARYLVPTLPMLALMGAYGLQALRSRELRRAAVGCAVLCSLVVVLYGYLPFLERHSAGNVQRAGAYLDGLPEERVEVFTLAGPEAEVNPAVSVPLLDLYTRKALVRGDAGTTAPDRRRTERSALRFTWEVPSPGWYAPGAADPAAAVVVISDDLERPWPDALARRLRDHHLARRFAADEGVFQHRTLVEIYRAARWQGPASEALPSASARHSLMERGT